ncbi:hypothetical protein K9N08_03120 [Candidatus Gracilibacteria bacterium]|nr:hypothetical protein [Candidatus Gracilibacteria bacterium]MCF7856521.1 hypothetical protein [Candidatus Gracilibacteria bacterium]MCF7896583.1 hypothetical protein [Candidatus Gracilibacteria bacterium]
MSSDKIAKKRLKAKIKLAKAKRGSSSQLQDKASPALRFAEIVRGLLYIIGASSLALAVILQEKGTWITLDDIVENLLLIRVGQIVLMVIALALFIYGLKHIRLVR